MFQLLKNMNVRIIVIGIGSGVSTEQLTTIASEPKQKNLFKISDFDKLVRILDGVIAIVCS